LHNRPRLSELGVIYPDSYLPYDYESHLGGFINALRDRVQRVKIRPLERYLRAGDAIMDVGCGDGHFLDLVRRFGDPSWTLYGVDFSELAAERLRARGLNALQQRFEELDWADGTVGAIVMNQLIEHVEDPTASIAKAYDVLKPGGVLIMETPTLDGWDARLFRARYWGGWHAPRHWNLFTAQSLGRCVEEAGFHVAEVNYLLSPYSWLHSIQYFLTERLGWRRLARLFDVDRLVMLCASGVVDLAQIALSGKTASMRLIAQKPGTATA
jgi:SAM-dependent methyltransferase